MSVNVIVVASTLIIGSVIMYWLQEWTENLRRQVQVRAAQPVTLKVVEIAIETPRAIMGRDDERVSTAVSFEVQLPLQAPVMIRAPWLIEAGQLTTLRAGHLLPVKFNARLGQVVFPNVSWAAYDWHRASQVLPMPEPQTEAV